MDHGDGVLINNYTNKTILVICNFYFKRLIITTQDNTKSNLSITIILTG